MVDNHCNDRSRVYSGFNPPLHHSPTNDVFKAVKDGYLDLNQCHQSLLISLISLITGFCLGPEVPTGMLAAGLGSWVSKLRGMGSDESRISVLSGISGAYAGLFFITSSSIADAAGIRS